MQSLWILKHYPHQKYCTSFTLADKIIIMMSIYSLLNIPGSFSVKQSDITFADIYRLNWFLRVRRNDSLSLSRTRWHHKSTHHTLHGSPKVIFTNTCGVFGLGVKTSFQSGVFHHKTLFQFGSTEHAFTIMLGEVLISRDFLEWGHTYKHGSPSRWGQIPGSPVQWGLSPA